MRTIEQLNTLLEELEKRIRNISTAQSTLAQINNICTYIANVQDYLKELNIAFDDHVQNCQDYTDDITNLQNQINEISASLEELISNDETFNALKTSFDDLKSQFETFIGSSSTTAENLENDISLLQTDLAVTQDDVTTLQSDLSDTNKTIGEHTTTITNLQTTQTNLQTTQSSQASTINSLNTRLTNCENNVNSLSGGVDISDYEARLTALENINGPACAHATYSFHNAKPSNYTLYTREYYFSCDKGDLLYQKCKLNYETISATTLTISIYENQEPTGETFVIDLDKYPREFEICRQKYATQHSHNIMIKAVADADIMYNSLDLWLFGKNIRLYDFNQDVKVSCFDNKIYITRYYDDCVKYGKFNSSDEIDLDNLPYSQSYNTALGNFRYLVYGVYYYYMNSRFEQIEEGVFYGEDLSNNSYVLFDAEQSDKDTNYIKKLNKSPMCGGEIYPSTYMEASTWSLKNLSFQTGGLFSAHTNTFNNLSKYYTGEFLCYCLAQDVTTDSSESPLYLTEVCGVALADDKGLYFVRHSSPNYFAKICSGGDLFNIYSYNNNKFFNIYVRNGTTMKKYKYEYNSTSPTIALETTLIDCHYIYDLPDGGIIKKTTTGWMVEKATIDDE